MNLPVPATRVSLADIDDARQQLVRNNYEACDATLNKVFDADALATGISNAMKRRQTAFRLGFDIDHEFIEGFEELFGTAKGEFLAQNPGFKDVNIIGPVRAKNRLSISFDLNPEIYLAEQLERPAPAEEIILDLQNFSAENPLSAHENKTIKLTVDNQKIFDAAEQLSHRWYQLRSDAVQKIFNGQAIAKQSAEASLQGKSEFSDWQGDSVPLPLDAPPRPIAPRSRRGRALPREYWQLSGDDPLFQATRDVFLRDNPAIAGVAIEGGKVSYKLHASVAPAKAEIVAIDLPRVSSSVGMWAKLANLIGWKKKKEALPAVIAQPAPVVEIPQITRDDSLVLRAERLTGTFNRLFVQLDPNMQVAACLLKPVFEMVAQAAAMDGSYHPPLRRAFSLMDRYNGALDRHVKNSDLMKGREPDKDALALRESIVKSSGALPAALEDLVRQSQVPLMWGADARARVVAKDARAIAYTAKLPEAHA